MKLQAKIRIYPEKDVDKLFKAVQKESVFNCGFSSTSGGSALNQMCLFLSKCFLCCHTILPVMASVA